MDHTSAHRTVKFSPPLIGQEEIDEVVDTLHSDWITTGPKTKRFEEAFREYVDAPGAVALNSCTAGLHTALVTAGIGPGDEVVTTPMTFAATVNVIEHVGACPVLVDVEPDTLNIDPAQVAASVTPRTKAIIPVHYAGHPAELDDLQAVASRHGLMLLEDAAHAIPASYKGRKIGSGSNPVAYSFYATKNLTTAEGGMLTGDPEFIDKARVVSLHGMSRDAWKRYDGKSSWRYDIGVPGFKYNMTDIQAAIGLWQLRKLAGFQQRRRDVVGKYREAFAATSGLELPVCRPYVDHAWHLFVLRVRPNVIGVDRDELIERLKARNIGVSVHFIPIHLHSYYRDKYGYRPEDFPVTLDAFNRMLSLPLNPSMTDADVAAVIDAVADSIGGSRRMVA